MAEPRRDASEDGKLADVRILVVEARFYHDIAEVLLAGATHVLEEAGASWERGARPFDGVVALGCVIRGDTMHFDIVANESARALMDLAVARRLPVGNGILTVETEAQAWARARQEEGNKGGDAARAALAMVRLKRGLEQ
jgi:6,7-dimethyl-8-ribityllumazine synthase